MFNKFLSLSLAGLLLGQTAWAEISYSPAEGSSKPSESTKGSLGSVFGTQDMGGNVDYREFDLSYPTPRHAAIRSAVLPGWGQLYNGEERKGILYISVGVVLLASSFATYNDAQKSYEDYRSGGQQNSNLYDDYSNKITLTWVLAGAYLVLWGSSVYDAAHHATSYSKNSQFQIAYSENGEGALRYRRRF